MGTGSVWVFWEDGRTWVMSVGLWEGERWQMEAREGRVPRPLWIERTEENVNPEASG